MGGSEAKIISTKEHQITLQYSSNFQWDKIQSIIETLKACFPNSIIGSYRTRQPTTFLQVYAAKDKNTCKEKVYSATDQAEEQQRLIVETIKAKLAL